jgi:NitT/TauT family transport system permease protein
MAKFRRSFHVTQRSKRPFTWGDLVVLLLIAALLYVGARLSLNAPAEIRGPEISLDPTSLPWYTLLSVGRMVAAYILSMLFSLLYGRAAAYNKRAEQVLMPVLDVLQSVPILSFLPVVLLSLSAFLSQNVAAELASIVLIFTSQAWNLTFSWYQSLTTIPKELREASAIFHLNTWMQFKRLELPFGMISLIWNSMMSWAGGWFFLMAAESFTVGMRDFRLPGLGSYLRHAASQSNFQAIGWGVGALVLTIVLLDQLMWRPLLAWSDRFKIEATESENPPTSWFYNLINGSRLLNSAQEHLFQPLTARLDAWTVRRFPPAEMRRPQKGRRSWLAYSLGTLGGLALAYGLFRAVLLLLGVPGTLWANIGLGVGATFLRVTIALLMALAWTIPLGVAIGFSQRLFTILQPLVQIAASVPATALFPIWLLFLLHLPQGLNISAVLLMLLGTQWYLLFNIIAGASAIPQDLKYTTQLLHLNLWQRWRTLILPGIFPYLITGAITASGGAWNASIVAEYQNFAGKTLQVTGVGALISQAAAAGDYPLLMASTLSMVLIVILVNRLFWRRLYVLAEEKYRME